MLAQPHNDAVMGESSKPIRRLVCVIRGRVHGVGFRWTVAALARELRCAGVVRNVPSGAVELVAEGFPEALERLRAFCYRGPDGAMVESVDVREEPATGEFTDFSIQH